MYAAEGAPGFFTVASARGFAGLPASASSCSMRPGRLASRRAASELEALMPFSRAVAALTVALRAFAKASGAAAVPHRGGALGLQHGHEVADRGEEFGVDVLGALGVT